MHTTTCYNYAASHSLLSCALSNYSYSAFFYILYIRILYVYRPYLLPNVCSNYYLCVTLLTSYHCFVMTKNYLISITDINKAYCSYNSWVVIVIPPNSRHLRILKTVSATPRVSGILEIPLYFVHICFSFFL